MLSVLSWWCKVRINIHGWEILIGEIWNISWRVFPYLIVIWNNYLCILSYVMLFGYFNFNVHVNTKRNENSLLWIYVIFTPVPCIKKKERDNLHVRKKTEFNHNSTLDTHFEDLDRVTFFTFNFHLLHYNTVKYNYSAELLFLLSCYCSWYTILVLFSLFIMMKLLWLLLLLLLLVLLYVGVILSFRLRGSLLIRSSMSLFSFSLSKPFHPLCSERQMWPCLVMVVVVGKSLSCHTESNCVLYDSSI